MPSVDTYTKSLMHFDTDFTDVCKKAWQPVGNPVINTSMHKFKSGGSMYLDGNSYLNTYYHQILILALEI